MLVEMKPVRQRVFDLLIQSNICVAMYMVSGKEPTGDIREDLKHVRAINLLDIATGTTGITAGNQTLSHRGVVSGYSGYGAKFYQDGSLNDILLVDVYPVSVYPQDLNIAYDGSTLWGTLRNFSGYFPSQPYESVAPTAFNASAGDSPGAIIADYGTVFNFRKLSCLNYATVGNYNFTKVDYSLDGVTWTPLTIANSRTQLFDFSARYIRYTTQNTAVQSFAYVWKVVPKDNAFVQETIDKVVLVRYSGPLMGTSAFGVNNPLVTNYIGITLDVGTDVIVSDTVTGNAAIPYFQSCRIAFDSNVVEA